MRICHVIEATAGGSARIAMDLIGDQLQRGEEVTLVCSQVRADAWFLETVKATKGLKVVTIPMTREINLGDILSLLRILCFFATTRRFDIVHSHSSKAGALARLAGILFPFTKQIYSPHAFYTMSNVKTPFYGWIEKLLSFFSDKIILVSPLELRHATERLAINKKKLALIVNGIALLPQHDRQKARMELGAEEQEFAIGFVGRLEEAKNPLRLLDAFAIVAEKLPSAWLYIVGEGVLEAPIRQKIAALKLNVKQVISNEARRLIPGFDCLVCSSDYESFCLVIIEALAEYVPVVSTPVGITEIAIIQGENGYIADFSPESLAESIIALSEKNYAIRMENMQKCSANLQQFDINTMLSDTYNLYKNLLC